jgi:hypothetical protein
MSALIALISAATSIPAGIRRFIAFLRSPLGRLVGIGLIVAIASGASYMRGKHQAEAACDAAAARAELAAIKIDRDNQAARADHATKILAFIQSKGVKDQEEIETLRQEVSRLELQSTKPGAKKDDKALLDDRCNVTERGARQLRR